MGIELHYKSYFPGYHSMRDLNEDVNRGNWPIYFGDRTLTNGQYYNGFMQTTSTHAYPGYDKDSLKQKMLEHEATFKNQVYELHRLYRVQRSMMEEITKERHKHRISVDTSSGSSHLASQMPSEDARKWHVPSFPLANSAYAGPSVLGAEILSSPLSLTNGNSRQAGRVPYKNCSTSKDYEVLESRPTKVRKKLFDLQLPADEYIDTEEGEQVQNNRTSDIPSHPLSRNHETAHQNNSKFFLGGGGRTNCRGDASPSDSCLKSSAKLADLNEPIQSEEATALISVDFVARSYCNGESRGLDFSAKRKSEFLRSSKELRRNSYHGSNIKTLHNLAAKNEINGKGWFSNSYEAGHSKSNLAYTPQGLHQEKFPVPSHLNHVMLNKAHLHAGVFPADHSRDDLCRDRISRGLEFSDRDCDLSASCLEPVAASHTPNRYPFDKSSDPVNSWSPPLSSLGKPTCSSTQKLPSAHPHPFLQSSATLSRSSQSSAPNNDIYGDNWNANGSNRLHPGMRSEHTTQKGFHHGSSSESKNISICYPSVGFDNQKCTTDDNLASQRPMNHGSEKFFYGSNFLDVMSGKDINLNAVLSKVSSHEVVFSQELKRAREMKSEDDIKALAWLRAKPDCKNGSTDTKRATSLFQASNSLLCQSEVVKDLNHVFSENVISPLRFCDTEPKKEIDDSLSNGRIFGLPISGYLCTSRKESPLIDINLACDPSFPETDTQIAAEVVVVEKPLNAKRTGVRNLIDLNSCICDEEDLLAPSVASTGANVRIRVEIDLEAPAPPDAEEDIVCEGQQKQYRATLQSPEHKAEEAQDEVARIAAEAIVAISASDQRNHKEDTASQPSEDYLVDPLLWFVEVVSSHANEHDKEFGREARDKNGGEIEDSFEAMALQLVETKEDDYMPKPFVPEIQEVEETEATSQPSRLRRGQTRRGRQRRDFQRDILPGLASLSRHEVTEDLQTFGGLMRATGHHWNSGLNRRNGTRSGAARARRQLAVETVPSVVATAVHTPLMQQLSNIEAGLEERGLTGWGKTPRRPRRQRCPAGNPPPVPLT